jgi:cell division septation protein DedD
MLTPPRPVTRPQPYTPQVVHSPAFDPDAQGDDGEDRRANRSRMVAVAIVVAALVLGGVVAFSTGILDRFLPGHAPKTAVSANVTPTQGATGATGATTAETSNPAPGPSGTPNATPVPPRHAAAAATSRTTFGIQVAAFRTAGRAEHALKDLEDTTHLPGEVLFADGPDNDSWYRIVLGRFPSEAAAHSSAKDLLDKSLIAEAIVIPYTPREP